MPDMPPTFRPHGRPTARELDQAFDRRRLAASETRKLYGRARWRAIRADQLRREPLCRMCRERGELVEATICDHVEPHGGDVDKFWAGPFQSLCKQDHDQVKQAEEAAARRASMRKAMGRAGRRR